MKKLYKFISLFTLGISLIPTASLTGCGNKEEKKIDPIIEPTTEQKQKECAEDSNICTYEVQLSDSITVPEGSTFDATLTPGTKSIETAKIESVGDITFENKKVSFQVQIDNESNNKTDISVEFSVTINCKNGDQSLWTKEISGYKIHKIFDTEKHQINVSSTLTDIEITCDKTTVNETDEFILTIKNNRSEIIDDANLSIIVGDQYTNIDLIESMEAGATKTLTFTKKSIKETYFSEVTISDDAAFDFKVVRCGAYNVDSDNYVHQINYNGENGEKLTAEQIPENQFLMKNSYGEFKIHTEMLEQFLSAATESSYELTMLRGEFGDGTGQSTSSACNLKMSGVLDASGERVSKFILMVLKIQDI